MDRQDLIDAISDRLEDRQDYHTTMRSCAVAAVELLVELGLLLPEFGVAPSDNKQAEAAGRRAWRQGLGCLPHTHGVSPKYRAAWLFGWMSEEQFHRLSKKKAPTP